jgi:hypothetical protein
MRLKGLPAALNQGAGAVMIFAGTYIAVAKPYPEVGYVVSALGLALLLIGGLQAQKSRD